MEFAPSLEIIINETLPALQKVCCYRTVIKLGLSSLSSCNGNFYAKKTGIEWLQISQKWNISVAEEQQFVYLGPLV